MAKSLTVKSIESAKPRVREYKITVDRGLYVRIAPSGIKTWLVRYVVDGHQKQVRLPKVFGNSGEGFMSLSEAKSANAEIQSLARSGIDYQTQLVEKKKELEKSKEQKENEALTFCDLFKVWIRDGVNRSDGNKYLTQSFGKHALPVIGDNQLGNLTEHHLRDIYRSIIAEGKIATAVELSKDVKQMLKWAEKRKPWRSLLIDGNPADLVEINKLLPKGYTKERKRLLSIDELRTLNSIFLNITQAYSVATDKYKTERPLKQEVQIAMWICLSTLCRIGELLKTEWKHVSFEKGTWFIPAENTKGTTKQKRDQLVFLSDYSLHQFRQLFQLTGDTQWAFPARYNDGHVCIKSASKQVGDRQVKFKCRTKKLKYRVENDSLVLGAEEWTPHDLRRTGATMMQKLKIHRDVINLCQNHVIGSKVDRVYLLDDYADEKRDAWKKLGNWLDTIFNSKNVLYFNGSNALTPSLSACSI